MNGLDIPLDLRLPARTARTFAKAGIETVRDLLRIAPRRYYHWGALTPLSTLREGDDVTILAEVVSTSIVANRSRPGVRCEVQLTDGVATIGATFFAKNEYTLIPHRKILTPGASMLFSGKVGSYRGRLQLTHPNFEGAEGDEEQIRRHVDRPIPIYPTTAGITSWVISRAIGVVLDTLTEDTIPDALGAQLRATYALASPLQAYRFLHQPEDDEQCALAKKTFAWEEALILQGALLAARRGARALEAPACQVQPNSLVTTFMESLPYELTQAQDEALGQISADLSLTQPMLRLLQGDVGSGKTVVALAALIQVVGAGYQGALLAPTEVLALQHVESIRALLTRAGILGGGLIGNEEGNEDEAPPRTGSARAAEDSTETSGANPQARGVEVRLLTGSTPLRARREIHALMESGVPMIVVGTHALLSEGVSFGNLALAVVDEQHRFGVAQRDKLRVMGPNGRGVHQLVMTATPIPRTIAMTVFGDLDETRMTGLPPGRTPVQTFLVDSTNASWMERLWQRAREEVDGGGRVYVVCPRIDQDDDVPDGDEAEARRPPLASVNAVAHTLRGLPVMTGVSIAELTGRTSNEDKDAVMAAFSAGTVPVIVATTVIEVGIDVPEATMMVILDAQQFGLSQLHQLRGRVGRSDRPSVCMAVHRHEMTDVGRLKLQAFASTTNGFDLAEEDMKIRQEGDVLGAQQSGRRSHLEFLSVRRDAGIIEKARSEAERIIEDDPDLSSHRQLEWEIIERSGETLAWLERS
ncbi:ATP-dependent DNA helicase RecG [Schaalia sp. ZJ405]|uniref:ATP-dependent DNA helicase RecG n=1 Tax=Schaalia sp. ZJ405 TaxID=2709403 RepID=UPI0013EBC6F8|nr:ATP-dependent DNA helicase RecG [Schaalia sp. ZJ405]QPK82196.1 ATP-dependent DNA helicase RecG [Schaalia sp. ZJ405]